MEIHICIALLSVQIHYFLEFIVIVTNWLQNNYNLLDFEINSWNFIWLLNVPCYTSLFGVKMYNTLCYLANFNQLEILVCLAQICIF